MGRSLARVLVVLSVAGAGLVAGAAPASAVGSIVVTPSTNLVDGQVVSITGSGWEPGHLIGFCQAVPGTGSPSQNDCAVFPSTVNADANGAFSVSLFVSRVITVRGQTFDCAAPSSPCVAAAADAGDIAGTVVSVPLVFAAAPPLIIPGFGEVTEGDSGTTSLVVPVALSFASTNTVTVDWATGTLFCPGFFGASADAGTDYLAAAGTLTFPPGATSGSVPITVFGDTLAEPDECVGVSFTNPTNAMLAPTPIGTGVIRTDENLDSDLIVKRRSDGTLFFDDEYTHSPGVYFHSITPGGYWTFAVLAQNDGNVTGDFVVTDEPSADAPFSVQYFYGYYDVTGAVHGDGLLLPAMAPGESRLFAVRFHADPGTPADAMAEVVLRMRSEPEPAGFGDELRLRVVT